MRHLIHLILVALFGSSSAYATEILRLGLPVDCDMQNVCSIHKYVDHDPSPNRVDYACGRLSKDGDTGTDFRTPSLVEMEAGVAVIAAADGVVRATRDGMDDISVREIGHDAIRNRFAGNAVVLSHPGGWETQYSHLKRGSVAVGKGDRVKAGDVLGAIGLSGNTEFPHVEFTVRRNKKPVDPFVGERGEDASPFDCRGSHAPLEYATLAVRSDSPALVFWVDVFGSEQGDTQSFKLTGPNGAEILDQQSKLKKNNITWFAFAGKKRPEGGWPRGEYIARYSLEREGRIVAEAQQVLEIK